MTVVALAPFDVMLVLWDSHDICLGSGAKLIHKCGPCRDKLMTRNRQVVPQAVLFGRMASWVLPCLVGVITLDSFVLTCANETFRPKWPERRFGSCCVRGSWTHLGMSKHCDTAMFPVEQKKPINVMIPSSCRNYAKYYLRQT